MQKLADEQENTYASEGRFSLDHDGLDAVGLVVVQICDESPAIQKLVDGHDMTDRTFGP
jgi:hypothetical protein